jgi:hypothetical protein
MVYIRLQAVEVRLWVTVLMLTVKKKQLFNVILLILLVYVQFHKKHRATVEIILFVCFHKTIFKP